MDSYCVEGIRSIKVAMGIFILRRVYGQEDESGGFILSTQYVERINNKGKEIKYKNEIYVKSYIRPQDGAFKFAMQILPRRK